jgi:two-component system, OmpR family, phosphate regulon sensor histidine kinase PhoR
MRNKLFNIIITVTAIALSGIIVTQFYWVRDALQLKNEQFYQNAGLGLKRVVNQIMALQNDSTMASKFMVVPEGVSYHAQFVQSLDPELINSMITDEFKTLELCQEFSWGIYEEETMEFVMISNADFETELRKSIHAEHISCIFQEEQFVISVFFPLQQKFVLTRMQIYIFLSALFMAIVIGGFWYVTSSLLRQKKLSEMKNDFVNNMTHELKTPIATISVSTEMLMRETVWAQPVKIKKYADIIQYENNRLKTQVDHVLQVARLDRGHFMLNREMVDLHELVNTVTENFQVNIGQRQGIIRKRLNAANPEVLADQSHLMNVINNLLDNADKYSPEAPEIIISSFSNKKGLTFTIEDKGIGIPGDHIKHIFKKFHRVSTGNVHDVKGFGIGLYYVNTIIKAHGGDIKVSSEPGVGSSFTVFLPYGKKRSVL